MPGATTIKWGCAGLRFTGSVPPHALAVDALNDASTEKSGIITERAPGLELYLDPAVVKSGDAARVRSLLESALASLKPA